MRIWFLKKEPLFYSLTISKRLFTLFHDFEETSLLMGFASELLDYRNILGPRGKNTAICPRSGTSPQTMSTSPCPLGTLPSFSTFLWQASAALFPRLKSMETPQVDIIIINYMQREVVVGQGLFEPFRNIQI